MLHNSSFKLIDIEDSKLTLRIDGHTTSDTYVYDSEVRLHLIGDSYMDTFNSLVFSDVINVDYLVSNSCVFYGGAYKKLEANDIFSRDSYFSNLEINADSIEYDNILSGQGELVFYKCSFQSGVSFDTDSATYNPFKFYQCKIDGKDTTNISYQELDSLSTRIYESIGLSDVVDKLDFLERDSIVFRQRRNACFAQNSNK